MHPTMQRLYQATATAGTNLLQAELARRLNTSSQVVNNWESRGISQKGANHAQAEFGVSATWILNGTGPMRTVPHPSHPVGFDVEKLADLIETVEAAAIQANRPIPPRTKARILASLYSSDASKEAVKAALASILATLED